MRPDGARDDYAGPAAGPVAPFPLKLAGPVVSGFGRGSRELGIPTANIPISGLSVGGHDDLASGVYFGFAGLEDVRNSAATTSTTSAIAASDAAAATVSPEAAAAAAKSSLSSPSKGAEGRGRGKVYPMVMSLGYNPFYKNSARSVEVHVMHAFDRDFYGAQLKLSILGFIRPEYDYVSRDALVEDINTDIEVARRSLEREAWRRHGEEDAWLTTFDGEVTGT